MHTIKYLCSQWKKQSLERGRLTVHSAWPGTGGSAWPCAKMMKLLRCREREEHTVFCYRLPTVQSWKAGIQQHENIIYENHDVITASLFSAENFGWQVLSADNFHVSYRYYFSTCTKITQTLVSSGKNTLLNNACQCVLICMLCSEQRKEQPDLLNYCYTVNQLLI